MDLLTILSRVGVSLAKILCAQYLGVAGAIPEDLADLIYEKIKDKLDRDDAKHHFELIGNQVVRGLLPLFKEFSDLPSPDVERVVERLVLSLEKGFSARIIIKKDLNAAQILQDLRSNSVIPRDFFSEPEEELYLAALDRAVRYLLEVAGSLPRFNTEHVTESLRRLSEMGRKIDEIARRIERIEHLLLTTDKQGQEYEANYRLILSRKLDYVELFGGTLSLSSRRQALSAAYISLRIAAESREGTDLLPVEAVLQRLSPRAGRLLIRGGAGSGKSTLFRWIAIEAAANTEIDQAMRNLLQVAPLTRFTSTSEERMRVSWRRKVPFLIRLRDCEGGRFPGPDDFADLIAREIGKPPTSWILSILKAGNAILLFDGIDELPNLHRTRVRRGVEEIVLAYPDNYFIISTRPDAIPLNWLARAGFREARLEPLSDSDRSKFIDKWHEAVAAEFRRSDLSKVNFDLPDDLPKFASSLKLQMEENTAIGSLARNPLLCAMICALHRDNNKSLPGSMAGLCESLCELLLVLRDQARGLSFVGPEPYRNLNYDQKRAIVREIAYYMVLNSESSIPAERAIELICSIVRQFPGHLPSSSREICEGLIERSGMLREIKPGYLDFVHNTLKEFLAGDRIAGARDAGFLVRNAFDPVWQRVLLFAVTTRDPGFATEVIERLLNDEIKIFGGRQFGYREPRRARRLLALRCFATALFVDPKMPRQMAQLAGELAPPQNMSEAEAFVSLRNLEDCSLLWRRSGDHDEKEAAACVRALRLIGTPQAREGLRTYDNDRRSSVIAELAQIFNPLSIRYYREEYVFGGEKLPLGIAELVDDLSPLVALPVARMRAVSSLNLSGTAISDIKEIAGMINLEALNLSGARVIDLGPLEGLPRLRRLDLSGTRVSDLRPLSSLSELGWLDLSGSQVADLSPLGGLKNLLWLDLVQTAVRDLTPLSQLESLEYLDIRQTRVKSTAPLTKLSRYGRINVKGPT